MSDTGEMHKLMEQEISLEKEKVRLDNQKVNKKEEHWVLVCKNVKISQKLK